MGNIFIKKENTALSNLEIENCMALFDEQFSVSEFSNALSKTAEESKNVIGKSREAIIKALNDDDNNYDYVLDLSQEDKKAIEVGDLLLDMDKDGNFFAQYRNANGNYGKKIPVKKKLEEEGISQEALLLALQMETIKAQLERVVESLKDIKYEIKQVEQGQRNDRIGLYYSGLSLVMEAREVNDIFLKKQLYAQAFKALNDANAQMIQDVRTSIDYLVNCKYKGKANSEELIDEHLRIIKQCCGLICKGASVKAKAFLENNEVGAAAMAIGEYGRFLDKMIMPYAGKLSELDANEKFIQKGTWGKVVASSHNCQEIAKQLVGRKEYLISVEE